MDFFKKSFILLLFFSLSSGCATFKKDHTKPSPDELLNRYRLSGEQDRCQAYNIQGIIYYFSKHQNFRGRFYLKGNTSFPWIMEIKSPFGTLLSMIEIKKDIVKVFSIKENKVYILKKPSEIFTIFGVNANIPPGFLLKVLTGEWKTFISKPKKIEEVKNGVKYYFNDQLVKEMELAYDLNKILIKGCAGGRIEIFNNSKVVLKDTNLGELVFKIRKKNCFKDKFKLKELNLKTPLNVTKEVILKGNTTQN